MWSRSRRRRWAPSARSPSTTTATSRPRPQPAAPATRRGRVGDTPLVGAGTYADARCAISATGHGEAIIRAVAGHDVAARLRAGDALDRAAEAVLDEVVALGGEVGLLALDISGEVALPFAADVFHRAVKRAGAPVLAAVGTEPLSPV